MKITFLLLSLACAVLARPHHVVQYSQDGRGFSYAYETPFLQPYAQFVPRAQALVQPAFSQQFVPAVRYSFAPIAQAKYVEPANIQLSADGFVLDTPEVANARAEHLAAVAQESARAGSLSENEAEEVYQDDTVQVGEQLSAVKQVTYQEPANIQVGADGHLLDTPEVSQAKAEHLAAYAAESAKTSSFQNTATYNFVQPIVVQEPAPVAYSKPVEIANIQVSSDGHVLDTPEVAQAKAAHFAQYANDAARAIAAGGDTSDYSDSDSNSVVNNHAAAISFVALRGSPAPLVTYKVDDPPADIKVSADGFVLDTPEVAQAKSAHFAKLAQAASTSHLESNVVSYGAQATAPSYVAYTSPSIAYTSAPVAYSAPIAYSQPKWNGPEADIRVGADGFLLDTPEVQQARAEHLATRSSVLARSQSSGWTEATSRYAAQVVPTVQYQADTPEVASAKAAHLAAHAHETARNTQTYGQLVYSAPIVRTVAPRFGYSFASPYSFLGFRYAPTAAPVALTADGQYLLDTPEVAAAKADHFAAHARARYH